MEQNNYIFFSKKIGEELLSNNPALRPSSIKSYSNIIYRLVKGLEENDYNTQWIGNIPFVILRDYEDVTEFIIAQKKSDRTTKNYLSVVVSLIRGLALDNPGICEDACNHYRKVHEEYIKKIGQKEMEQKPSEKEEFISTLNMNQLRKGLKYHEQALKKNPYDIETAVLLFVGTIATELCLRNEPASMVITNKYLDPIEYPKTNFLWNKGRNKKVLVVRENKVRLGGKDPEKALEINGHVNSIINKYLHAYLYCDPGFADDLKDGKQIPLIWKTKGDISSNISGAGYCAMLKRVWAHMKIEMTSTLIRKLFSIDIRKQYGGKLIEEIKACEKLDHSLGVHNSNYILFFE